MSFINGVFPENLKIVKVIPVHKGGYTQDMNNFRPILEKLINDTIINLVSGKINLLFLHYYKD